jgi:6-phosphofructokinase
VTDRFSQVKKHLILLTMQALWTSLGYYQRGYVVIATLSAYGAVVWVATGKALKR